ncbi:MAG: enoyl-CoA hydratase, partial [Ardenticatenia bacterium]
MSEKLLVQREGHITTLTINRPEIRNAVDPETMIAIREAVEACEDDGTRVIVLTGAGGA